MLERLYSLLPTLYRTEDKTNALRALLAIMEQELNVIETTIANSYEDLFIETCNSNKITSIANLIGEGHFNIDDHSIINERAYVGNLISLRRRKGTLNALEKAIFTVTRWPCHIVEFYKYLSIFQTITQPYLKRGQLINLQDYGSVTGLATPFDSNSYLMQVTNSPYMHYYTVPAIGVFLWHKQVYSIKKGKAKNCGDYFTFHSTGIDTPLFNNFDEHKVRVFKGDIFPGPILSSTPQQQASNDLDFLKEIYGEKESFFIWILNKNTGEEKAINLSDIQLINYNKISYLANNKVGIDLKKGRIVLGSTYLQTSFRIKNLTDVSIKVNYSYGFNADLGGGSYVRHVSSNPHIIVQDKYSRSYTNKDTISNTSHSIQYYDTLNATLNLLNTPSSECIVIEIRTNDTYDIDPNFTFSRPIILQAANGYRPCLHCTNGIAIAAEVTMRGLLIDGKINLQRGATLNISDCTLVPKSTAISIASHDVKETIVNIRSSIVGPLRLNSDTVLRAEKSIIDGLNGTAISAANEEEFGGSVSLKRVTVLGSSKIAKLNIAHECLFSGPLKVANIQTGRLTYSALPPSSETPPRYQCYSKVQEDHPQTRKKTSFNPKFYSTVYGHPGYAELKEENAAFLLTGAETQDELGAFCGNLKAKRLNQLQEILKEYLPVGLEGKILYVA